MILLACQPKANLKRLGMLKMAKTEILTCFTAENPIQLENGQQLGPVDLAFETYGTLNRKKSNAVLVCHSLSGDAHAAFKHQDDPLNVGWWDEFIGPGKFLDTNRYYIICSNVLGGCKGSTGPNAIDPKTGHPYGLTFPVITVSDMVKAQYHLIKALTIDKLAMVIGGSMGGMQALEWAISYPDMIERCACIASTASLSPQAIAFDAVGRHAIISDPNWQEGNYYGGQVPEVGLSIARMIGHITYLSHDSMNKKFGRRLQEKPDYRYSFSSEFQVESYLQYQGNKFVSRFDANAYLYLTKAISYFDLGKKYGSLEKAFSGVTCQFLVVSIQSDWLYPPEQSKSIVKSLMKLNKDVTYCEMDSSYGHDAFLIDLGQLGPLVSQFLERTLS